MNNLNILVVDDEKVMRELFTRILGLKGYRVTAVEDGPKAIDMVKTQKFDLIFLDVVLPGIDGLEVFKEIKKVAVNIPIVVMMTGFSVEEKLREAERLGAFQSLYKPFDIPKIMDLVNKVQITKNTTKE